MNRSHIRYVSVETENEKKIYIVLVERLRFVCKIDLLEV